MEEAVDELTAAHDRDRQKLQTCQTPVSYLVNSSLSLPKALSMSAEYEFATSGSRPAAPASSILFDQGWHAWPGLNSKQLLCIHNGTVHLLGAGEAPWLCPVQDEEGEAGTTHEDFVHKGQEATTLFGSLWMDEESRGSCCKLKLLQNHTRDRRSYAIGAYEFMEQRRSEEWELDKEEEENQMDPYDDPFACVAVFGDWSFSFCDLRGGYDHVMSLRENGSVNLSYCFFNNLPQ
eukprot:760529-Hanusia_phi.AAC.1